MNIIFVNEPRIDDKIPEKSISLRKDSKNLIAAICEKNANLLGDDVSIEYFYEGLISVVAKITDQSSANEKLDKNKFVLKIRGGDNSAKEASVFEYWRKAGASVPYVYIVGKEGDLSYFIMEFIQGKNLKESAKDGLCTDEDVSEILGKLLADLHTSQLKRGAEMPQELKDSVSSHAQTTYRKFYEELGIARLEEQGVFPKEWFPSIDSAFKNVIEKEKNIVGGLVVGHMDFSSYNLFFGPPPVITDPNPAICLPVVDLAHTLVMAAHAQYGAQAYVEEILEAYEAHVDTNTRVDMTLLKDAFLVEAVTKIEYWLRVSKSESKDKLEPFLRPLIEENRFPWEV